MMCQSIDTSEKWRQVIKFLVQVSCDGHFANAESSACERVPQQSLIVNAKSVRVYANDVWGIIFNLFLFL